ncbi:MAG: hypothetical protein JST33_06360 [Actinobacteria bacterium]|nr:hypothetical protein [Actinomycetota bacterium]
MTEPGAAGAVTDVNDEHAAPSPRDSSRNPANTRNARWPDSCAETAGNQPLPRPENPAQPAYKQSITHNRIIAEDRLAAAREQEDQNLDDLDLIAASRRKDATRSADLDAREADLDRRNQETADDRLAAQNERQEAEEAQRVASAAQRVAERARAQAEADRQYARELVAKVEHIEPDIDRWLDNRKVGDGRTMRDLFDADMKKTRAARAEVQALINADAPARAADRTQGLGE